VWSNALAMADTFKIRGGKPLSGEIAVRGSKNSVLALIAASVVTSGKVSFSNVPRIRDVDAICDILRGLGSRIEWNGGVLVLDHSGLNDYRPDTELVRRFRGSILLAGGLLARFRKVELPYPGGDLIGTRPLDAHFAAFRALGAEISESGDHVLRVLAPEGLRGGTIVLPEASVTATENALIAASCAKGDTLIKIAATEPHVQDVARFLKALGVEISGEGTHTIRVRGAGAVIARNAEYRVIPDADEAMSVAVLAAATRSDLTILGAPIDHMDMALAKLRDVGVNFEAGHDRIHIRKPVGMYQAMKIKCGPHPQLGSDQIPPFAVLATQANGTSLIHEWMYEGRLGYVNELIKMGANAVVLDPHRALVIGPTPLRGAELQSLDIRSGMTVLIAGLVAEGETIIQNADVIDRGYERIEERLRAVGADIERVGESG